MGIFDGQPVNANTTNPAFLDANADDTAQGKLSLDNSTDPNVSGAKVENIQREFNALSSFTGKALNVAKSTTPAWDNADVGSPGDSLKTRADALTQRFNGATGHRHTGANGDGSQVSSTDLINVPLMGYFQQGADLEDVTGLSHDVSALFTTKAASSGPTVLGVVTNSPYNRVLVRYASGARENEEIVDTSGNQVFARLTENSGVWALSFYVLIGAVETPYSFSSAIDVRWYYQELFNPMQSSPVYDPMAFVPSDNTTADVVDASETVAGKVLLASSAAQSVGGANAKGSSSRAAREDHAHQGVHSLGIAGDPAAVFGDVKIKAGENVIVYWDNGQLAIKSTGAKGIQEIPTGPRNGTNTVFGPLSATPTDENSIVVFLDGIKVEKSLWSLVGSSIQLSFAPAFGQSLDVFYLTSGVTAIAPPPEGVFEVEYRTITLDEDAAKALTLGNVPATVSKVIVDVIGGSAQEFGLDFTVVGNVLTWSGYALDGVIATGDRLRIQYWT